MSPFWMSHVTEPSALGSAASDVASRKMPSDATGYSLMLSLSTHAR